MNARNTLVASVLALGCLFGVGAATAAAAPTEIPTVTRVCGIHYELTTDLNGRQYCKWAPKPRHNRHDTARRQAG
jgi:hypothetical protein